MRVCELAAARVRESREKKNMARTSEFAVTSSHNELKGGRQQSYFRDRRPGTTFIKAENSSHYATS